MGAVNSGLALCSRGTLGKGTLRTYPSWRVPTFGFAMKPTAWSKFLGGHRFASDDCEIELNNEKIDLDTYIDGTPPSRLKRKKVYIVRIGNKTK